jgi:Zinc carboxypeptidase/Secretion system C-terminal sorting domain
MNRRISAIFAFLLITSSVLAQNLIDRDLEKDKCGFDLQKSNEMHFKLGDKWGYSYDSLLNDIDYWSSFNQVSITTIGQSTLEREIFELTITDDPIVKSTKPRIFIHARTHPGEVQSFWVTDEIINLLLGNSPIGTFMRQRCIFHIIPMYNPDGVELEKPRENANDIDIESNWGSENPEIEVVALKNRFEELMYEENPIEIALNMHSAYVCERYFVFHHANGTSIDFAQKEINFIESIRQYFMYGIKPYDYYVSWSSGTPNYYPESWWWNNFGDDVMALTYEDMNCDDAGEYDKTAFAIIRGIADYLELGYVGVEEEFDSSEPEIKVYPNPFTDEVFIDRNNTNSTCLVRIYNIMGQKVHEISSSNEIITWDGKVSNGKELISGIYIVNIHHDNKIISKTIMKQ